MKTQLSHAVLKGGIGFCLVSLVVFASVAFGERWMYMHLGVMGAYVVWTLGFILLGGAMLGSLISGRWRLPESPRCRGSSARTKFSSVRSSPTKPCGYSP